MLAQSRIRSLHRRCLLRAGARLRQPSVAARSLSPARLVTPEANPSAPAQQCPPQQCLPRRVSRTQLVQDGRELGEGCEGPLAAHALPCLVHHRRLPPRPDPPPGRTLQHNRQGPGTASRGARDSLKRAKGTPTRGHEASSRGSRTSTSLNRGHETANRESRGAASSPRLADTSRGGIQCTPESCPVTCTSSLPALIWEKRARAALPPR